MTRALLSPLPPVGVEVAVGVGSLEVGDGEASERRKSRNLGWGFVPRWIFEDTDRTGGSKGRRESERPRGGGKEEASSKKEEGRSSFLTTKATSPLGF